MVRLDSLHKFNINNMQSLNIQNYVFLEDNLVISKESICCEAHWVLNGDAESLYCTPEINVILYGN